VSGKNDALGLTGGREIAISLVEEVNPQTQRGKKYEGGEKKPRRPVKKKKTKKDATLKEEAELSPDALRYERKSKSTISNRSGGELKTETV